MADTKENFNEKEPSCRVIKLDGVLYLAYEKDGVLHIVSRCNSKKNIKLFFVHRRLGEENYIVGELPELARILTAESILSPTRWNGKRWVPGIMTEEEMPEGFRWSFLNQCWAPK